MSGFTASSPDSDLPSAPAAHSAAFSWVVYHLLKQQHTSPTSSYIVHFYSSICSPLESVYLVYIHVCLSSYMCNFCCCTAYCKTPAVKPSVAAVVTWHVHPQTSNMKGYTF